MAEADQRLGGKQKTLLTKDWFHLSWAPAPSPGPRTPAAPGRRRARRAPRRGGGWGRGRGGWLDPETGEYLTFQTKNPKKARGKGVNGVLVEGHIQKPIALQEFGSSKCIPAVSEAFRFV